MSPSRRGPRQPVGRREPQQPVDRRDAATDPTSEVAQPNIGTRGMLRWAWRQLTSMRTALMLLMLLAIAAVPGSIWPQRGIDANRVNTYLDEHPTLGPILDSLGFFDVYSAPWFAAIYLLLVISLIGCIVPRTRIHWRALRAQPPKAPRRLDRLPAHAEREVAAPPQEVLSSAREVLRGRRYRLRRPDATGPGTDTGTGTGVSTDTGVGTDTGTVAAEGGYLKETGNLLFHIAVCVVILAIAVGHLWGWRGDVIVPEGEGFANTASRYDTLDPGPWVDVTELQPFSVALDSLVVTFETVASGSQFGEPRDFSAAVTTTARPSAEPVEEQLEVNGPLSFGDTSVFLLGNGYAPEITVRDNEGNVLYRQPTPFLPQDNNYRSVGAIKVPGAEPQLGFYGLFLPTLRFDAEQGPVSDFPGLVEPGLVLGVYEGELFPDDSPQSVYTLDTDSMDQVHTASGEVASLLIRPGETVDLPGDRGSITMGEVRRWGGLSVRHDPGKALALGSALTALGGLVLTLTVRRRRVFVRVRSTGTVAGAGGAGHTVVTVAGLAKGEDPGLQSVIEDVLDRIAARTGTPS